MTTHQLTSHTERGFQIPDKGALAAILSLYDVPEILTEPLVLLLGPLTAPCQGNLQAAVDQVWVTQ